MVTVILALSINPLLISSSPSQTQTKTSLLLSPVIKEIWKSIFHLQLIFICECLHHQLGGNLICFLTEIVHSTSVVFTLFQCWLTFIGQTFNQLAPMNMKLVLGVKLSSDISCPKQSQKKPVGALALPTGKFLRVRKVFARIYKIGPKSSQNIA